MSEGQKQSLARASVVIVVGNRPSSCVLRRLHLPLVRLVRTSAIIIKLRESFGRQWIYFLFLFCHIIRGLISVVENMTEKIFILLLRYLLSRIHRLHRFNIVSGRYVHVFILFFLFFGMGVFILNINSTRHIHSIFLHIYYTLALAALFSNAYSFYFELKLCIDVFQKYSIIIKYFVLSKTILGELLLKTGIAYYK